MDDGEAGEAPAHAEQAIAALAVVDKAELGLDARGAGRNGDGEGVGEGAAGADLMAAGVAPTAVAYADGANDAGIKATNPNRAMMRSKTRPGEGR